MIQKKLGKKNVEVKDIAKSTKEDIAEFDLLLIGIPTWYYDENQCDWDDFLPELEEIDFNDKIICNQQLDVFYDSVEIISSRNHVESFFLQ